MRNATELVRVPEPSLRNLNGMRRERNPRARLSDFQYRFYLPLLKKEDKINKKKTKTNKINKNQRERNEERKGVEGWERKVWAAAQVQRPA